MAAKGSRQMLGTEVILPGPLAVCRATGGGEWGGGAEQVGSQLLTFLDHLLFSRPCPGALSGLTQSLRGPTRWALMRPLSAGSQGDGVSRPRAHS